MSTRSKVTRLLAGSALFVAVSFVGGCTASSTPEPPVVDPMSESDIEAQALLDLKQSETQYLGAFPDLEVPVVTRIRFIETDDWAPVMAECLTDAGFPTVAAGGGIPSTSPDGQEQSWALAAYTCSAQYPIDPHLTRPLNDDQIRYTYDYYTQVSVPCMKNLGFDDVSPAPSAQTFIDQYAKPGSWSPYWDAATQASTDLWDQIQEECPETPPGIFG